MLCDSRSSHVGQSKVDVDGEGASAMTSGTLSRFFGGYVRGEIPDPIPNSEVKPSRADGTAREAAWESRTPPELILKGPMHLHGAFFLACGPGWAPAGERSVGQPGWARLVGGLCRLVQGGAVAWRYLWRAAIALASSGAPGRLSSVLGVSPLSILISRLRWDWSA